MRPTSPEFKFPTAKRFVAEKEPHWKGLGSPYNLQKDLACWLNESVYLDDRLPRDSGASKKLMEREEAHSASRLGNQIGQDLHTGWRQQTKQM